MKTLDLIALGVCIGVFATTLNAQAEQTTVDPDNIRAKTTKLRPAAKPAAQEVAHLHYSPEDEVHLRLFVKYLNENDFDNARLHALQIKENKWQLELIEENEAIYKNNTPEERKAAQHVVGVHRLALAGKFSEARDLASQAENDNSRDSLLKLVDQIEEQQKGVQPSVPDYRRQNAPQPEP